MFEETKVVIGCRKWKDRRTMAKRNRRNNHLQNTTYKIKQKHKQYVLH